MLCLLSQLQEKEVSEIQKHKSDLGKDLHQEELPNVEACQS